MRPATSLIPSVKTTAINIPAIQIVAAQIFSISSHAARRRIPTSGKLTGSPAPASKAWWSAEAAYAKRLWIFPRLLTERPCNSPVSPTQTFLSWYRAGLCDQGNDARADRCRMSGAPSTLALFHKFLLLPAITGKRRSFPIHAAWHDRVFLRRAAHCRAGRADDKAESVAGSDCVFSGGSLCFSGSFSLLPCASVSPECGHSRRTSRGPDTNLHRFRSHFLFRRLRKVRRHECPAGVAPRYLQQPRGPTHVGRLGFRFSDRGRLRIRHS